MDCMVSRGSDCGGRKRAAFTRRVRAVPYTQSHRKPHLAEWYQDANNSVRLCTSARIQASTSYCPITTSVNGSMSCESATERNLAAVLHVGYEIPRYLLSKGLIGLRGIRQSIIAGTRAMNTRSG